MNKTKVMRITQKEEKLLTFLRENDISDIIACLNSEFSDIMKKEEFEILKNFIFLLGDNNEVLDIETLIENDFITEEQLSYLLKAIQKNKNIIITGFTRVGKNYLMETLLKLKKDKNFLFIKNNFKNFHLSKDFFEYSDSEIIDRNLSLEDFTNPKFKNKTFVFNETLEGSDVLSLAIALNFGKNITKTNS